MAVLQQAGRIALAKAVAAQTIHIAWGRGLPAWDAAPEPEPITANALVDEIGRRLVTEVRFARPDDNGEIEDRVVGVGPGCLVEQAQHDARGLLGPGRRRADERDRDGQGEGEAARG